MQIWPWCRNEPNAPAEAALATSAPGSTTSALFPPSSRWTRLSARAAASPTLRPAAVEPVNDTTDTSGASTTAAPTPASPGSRCSRPSGSPASSKTRTMLTPPDTAVRRSGLSSTALPSARAGATDRIARISGKLNGEITETTPAGTRRASDQRGSPVLSTSPRGWVGRAAASKQIPAAISVSIPAFGRVEPASRTIQSCTSAAWASHSSPARRSTAARSAGLRRAQSRWASAAARAAAATSSGVATPTWPRVSPVAGSTTGWVPPVPLVNSSSSRVMITPVWSVPCRPGAAAGRPRSS